jgi:hypothetical protein
MKVFCEEEGAESQRHEEQFFLCDRCWVVYAEEG